MEEGASGKISLVYPPFLRGAVSGCSGFAGLQRHLDVDSSNYSSYQGLVCADVYCKTDPSHSPAMRRRLKYMLIKTVWITKQ